MIYTYERGGVTYTLNLEPRPDGSFIASIGERQYVVRAHRMGGGWLLDVGSGRVMAYTAARGNARYVHVGGQDYTLIVPETRTQRRKQSAGRGDLTAQMPGQVMNVLVAEGDSVEKGQTLVILEAMKMEIRVSAPGGGTVKRLLVQKGDVVERGQRLVEIE